MTGVRSSINSRLCSCVKRFSISHRAYNGRVRESLLLWSQDMPLVSSRMASSRKSRKSLSIDTALPCLSDTGWETSLGVGSRFPALELAADRFPGFRGESCEHLFRSHLLHDFLPHLRGHPPREFLVQL